jgi:hypothetical protein
MFDYLDDQQERFFTWCDKALQEYIGSGKAVFKKWWPRKSPEGSYELIFELAAGDRAPLRHSVTIPREFHDLLEREYFIDHPADGDGDEE